SGDGYRLSGALGNVPWAREALGVVVSITHPDGGPGLALLSGDWNNAGRGRNLASEPRDRLVLDGFPVEAAKLRKIEGGPAPDMKEDGAFLRAQQMVGAIERSVESAIGHASERRQFGRTLSQFQAIQHMLAETASHRAAATAAADFAAMAFGTSAF